MTEGAPPAPVNDNKIKKQGKANGGNQKKLGKANAGGKTTERSFEALRNPTPT